MLILENQEPKKRKEGQKLVKIDLTKSDKFITIRMPNNDVVNIGIHDDETSDEFSSFFIDIIYSGCNKPEWRIEGRTYDRYHPTE